MTPASFPFDDPAAASAALQAMLPPERLWEVSSEVHYYGAAHLITEACGIGDPPKISKVTWHHGTSLTPLWGLAEPDPPIPQEELDYVFHAAPRDACRLVVQKKEEIFLASQGVQRAIAVGAPYVYVPPQGRERIAGTLVAMPSHSFGGDSIPRDESIKAYAAHLNTLRQTFRFICVCLYGDDFESPTRALYEQAGFAVIRGAAIKDMNSLVRMRAMFETFECMTSNDIGSHVIYASATGCKVFIGGPSLWVDKESIWARHPFYIGRPNVMKNVLRWIDPNNARRRWPWLYGPPEQAEARAAWAHEYLGTENRRTPVEMANLLGWRYPFAGGEDADTFRRLAPAHGWENPQTASLERKVVKAAAQIDKLKQRLVDLETKSNALEKSFCWRLVRPFWRLEHSLRKRLGKRAPEKAPETTA